MKRTIDIANPSTWPTVLNPAEVGAILNMSRNHIYDQCSAYRATKQGIRNLKIGKSVRIPRTAVLELLGEKTATPMDTATAIRPS